MENAAALVTSSACPEDKNASGSSQRKVDGDDVPGMSQEEEEVTVGAECEERPENAKDEKVEEGVKRRSHKQRHRKHKPKPSPDDGEIVDLGIAVALGGGPINDDASHSQHPTPKQNKPKEDRHRGNRRDRPRSAKGKGQMQQMGDNEENDGSASKDNGTRPTSGRKQKAVQKGGRTSGQTPAVNPGRGTPDGPKRERPASSKGKKKTPKKADESSSPAPSRGHPQASRNPTSMSSDNKTKPVPQSQRSVDQGNPQTPKRNDSSSQRAAGSGSQGKRPRTPKSKSKNASGTPNGRKNFKPFEDYLSLEEVSDGLKRGKLLQGTLRINPKNFEESYINSPSGGADITIKGLRARNRALEGDVVAVQLLDKAEWRLLEEDYIAHRRNQRKTLSVSPKKSPTSKKIAGDTESTSAPEADLADQLQDLVIENSSQQEVDRNIGTSTADSVAKEGRDNSMFRVKGKAPSSSSVDSQSFPESSTSDAGPHIEDRHQPPANPKGEEIDQVVKRLFPDGLKEETQDCEDEMSSREAKNSSEIPDSCFQRSAKIVYIVEKRHSRACSGLLKPPTNNNATDALFSPTDHRMPRIYIPLPECPEGFQERPGDFEKTLFIARLEEWPKNSCFARGHLHRSLGEAGEIEPETEGMLIEYGVDYSDFSDEVIECLPKNLPWTIPREEIDRRRDFRGQCIFTIDPATARDLDDALSCVPLGDGLYEVGVHIADVSFFVDEDNELDRVAGRRATSVYLVQKVIPMLPRLLCEHLCSLNPNEDKLTFSFLWKLNERGEIVDEWCGRSVIRSCVKMSYDHAQGIIAEPEREWRPEEMPEITSGFSILDIAQAVLHLNKIAQSLRQKRSEDGALRLDQVKLQYALNKESGYPTGYSVYQQRDSNKLVEEFMLLANMAAAHRVHDFRKETALLRRHPPPKSKMIDDLEAMCSEMGLEVDVSSSKAIQESLGRYLGPQEDVAAGGVGQILTVLFSKPMERAKYFCAGELEDEFLYRHYALNVPLYTHFTSPIRRYADILVHRQLAASLGVGPVSDRDSTTIHEQAKRCNQQKEAAKKVSDMSNEMFFSIFVRECGPLQEDAMVMQVLDRSIDVLVLRLGVVKRVYCNALPLKSFRFQKHGKQGKLVIVWEADDMHPVEDTQILQIFSLVQVELEAAKEPLKYTATMKRPESE